MSTWQELITPYQNSYWKQYHEASKITHENIILQTDHPLCTPTPSISLLPPAPLAKNLSEAICHRRSQRELHQDTVSLELISSILLHSYSAQHTSLFEIAKKTAPSAGGLYPLSIYFNYQAAHEADHKSLEPGLYHYCPEAQIITKQLTTPRAQELEKLVSDSHLISKSSLQFFLVAHFEKTIQKYGERGYRFILIEAGHIAQNFNLVASALGLGCVNIGGYMDDAINCLLGFEKINQSVVYMFAVSFISQ